MLITGFLVTFYLGFIQYIGMKMMSDKLASWGGDDASARRCSS